MTDIEKRILENQMEILWALRHLAEKASPELVGRAGALDRMRDDLADAAKRTQALFVSSQVTRPVSACEHDWQVWPETDGQSQRCRECGQYRDTPDGGGK